MRKGKAVVISRIESASVAGIDSRFETEAGATTSRVGHEQVRMGVVGTVNMSSAVAVSIEESEQWGNVIDSCASKRHLPET
jgi:hypothetical protein